MSVDGKKIGLLALLLWLLARKRTAVTTSSAAPEASPDATLPTRGELLEMDLPGTVSVESAANEAVPWVWPVPSIVVGDRLVNAVVSSGYGGDRGDHRHAGQDVMYARAPGLPDKRKGDHGTRDYWAPGSGNLSPFDKPAPVLAARSGKVWSCRKTEKGWWIILDHGKPYSTSYLHMESVLVPAHKGGKQHNGSSGVVVQAGEQIGVMGFSPVDNGEVRHLHFEVRTGASSASAQDPALLQQSSWGRKTWRI